MSRSYKPWKQLTDAEKAQRAEERKQRMTSASDRLEAAVASMVTSDQWKAALRVANRFHQYSANNVFMIVGQRPEATRVAGFHSWKAMGRYVKKGAVGIKIFAPMKAGKRDSATPAPEPGAPNAGVAVGWQALVSEGQPSRPQMRFGVVSVFDIADTEGEPLPSFPEMQWSEEDRPEYHAALEALLGYARETLGCKTSMDPALALGSADGYWNAKQNLLWVAPDGPILSRLAVAIHETAHGLAGHRGTSSREERAAHEIVAEGAAFLVMDHFGLDCSAASTPYLAQYAYRTSEAVRAKSARTEGAASSEATPSVDLRPLMQGLDEARRIADQIAGEIEARWVEILPDLAAVVSARAAAQAVRPAPALEDGDVTALTGRSAAGLDLEGGAEADEVVDTASASASASASALAGAVSHAVDGVRVRPVVSDPGAASPRAADAPRAPANVAEVGAW